MCRGVALKLMRVGWQKTFKDELDKTVDDRTA